jgi:hypothetical protein
MPRPFRAIAGIGALAPQTIPPPATIRQTNSLNDAEGSGYHTNMFKEDS